MKLGYLDTYYYYYWKFYSAYKTVVSKKREGITASIGANFAINVNLTLIDTYSGVNFSVTR